MSKLRSRAVYHEVYRVARINARHSPYERPDAFEVFRGPDNASGRGVRFPGSADMARYEQAYRAGVGAASTHATSTYASTYEDGDPLAMPFPWQEVDAHFPFAVMAIRRGPDRSALRNFRGRLQMVGEGVRDPGRLP